MRKVIKTSVRIPLAPTEIRTDNSLLYVYSLASAPSGSVVITA